MYINLHFVKTGIIRTNLGDIVAADGMTHSVAGALTATICRIKVLLFSVRKDRNYLGHPSVANG